jgi:hypothetical protein
MRNLISNEEKEQIALKYYERIVKVKYKALRDLHDVVNLKGTEIENFNLDPTTLATLLNNFIRIRMKEEFFDEVEVEFDKVNRLFCMKISRKVALRFNKMSKNLKISPAITRQSKLYKNQLSIEGLEDSLTLFYGGYVMDSTWSSFKNIFIVCRKGDDVIWYRDLTSEMKQLRIIFEEEQKDNNQTIREGLRFKNNNNQEKTGTNE